MVQTSSNGLGITVHGLCNSKVVENTKLIEQWEQGS